MSLFDRTNSISSKSPSSLLPEQPERLQPDAEPAPKLGPNSLLAGEAQRPFAARGEEHFPTRGPSSLLPDAAGRPTQVVEPLPNRGPSSLLPDASDRWPVAGDAQRVPTQGPSSLLPDAGEVSRQEPERLSEQGPSSLLPDAAEKPFNAPPASSEWATISPSELLPPPSPPPRRISNRQALVLIAAALFVALVGLGVALRANLMLVPDANALIEKAKSQRAGGDYPGAILNLMEAARKVPNLPEARYLLGLTLLQAGDFGRAEQELRLASEFGHPADAVNLPLARSLLLQGKHETLLKEFTVESAGPTNAAEFLSVFGLAHLAADRTYLAREHFEKSLALDPRRAEALLGMARLAMRGKDSGQATSLVDRVLVQDPKNVDALVMRAELQRATGDLERIRTAYQAIIAEYPQNVLALVNLASLDLAQNRFEDAEKRLENAVKLSPRHANAAYLYGLLKLRRGELPEARNFVQRALQVSPFHFPSVLLAAAIEYADGKHSEAQQALLWVLHRNPYHLPARRMYGASLLQIGQPMSAIEILEPMLQVDSKNPALLSLLGQAYVQAGNYAKAGPMLESAARFAELRERATGRRREHGPRLEQEAAQLEQALNLTAAGLQTDIRLIVTHYLRRDYAKAERALQDALAASPNDVRLLNLRAAVSMARKDMVGAQRDLESALAIDPSYVPAAANLAQIDLIERRPGAARRRIESIHITHPRNVDALLALALLGPRIEATPEEIASWLEQAVKLDPGLTQTRILLARHYMERGQPHKALEELKAAKAVRANDPGVLDALAAVHTALGQHAEALASLTTLSLLRPDSAQVLHRLALAQIANRQHVAAGLVLRRTLVLDPALHAARLTLAQLDLSAGHVSEALQAATKLQQETPASPNGLMLEGDIHRFEGKLEAALAAYQRAWQTGRNGEVLLRLQQTLTALGRPGQAHQLMRAWLSEHPGDLPVRKQLAHALLMSGKLDSAMSEYLAVIKTAPLDAAILNNLAWTALQMKDKRALEFAERAYKLKPGDPDILDTISQVLAEHNETVRARELFTQAVSLAPERHDIRFRLAQFHVRNGDRREAIKELERLVAAGKGFGQYGEAVALLQRLQ